MSVNNDLQFSTIEEAAQWAARQGFTITADDYAQINALGQAAAHNTAALLDSAKPQSDGLQGIVDKFNEHYPKFIKALTASGNILIVTTANLLIAAVPIILFIILCVEVGRITHGIQFFEVSDNAALFGAIAVVLMNLGLELLVHYIEEKNGYKEPTKTEFSFRVTWQRVRYMFGLPTDNTIWTPRQKSPAQRWKSVLWLLTRSILIIALAGSMREVIKKDNNSWYVALNDIATKSTLNEIVSWLNGLLFTLVITLGAQVLSYYVSIAAAEIVLIMQSDATNKPELVMKAAHLAGVQYILSKVKDNQRQQRRAAMGTASAADMPTADNGTSGSIRVPILSDEPDNGTSAPYQPTMSKVDRAMSLLITDKSLRTKTTRQLEEMYPDIKRNTWSTARQRIEGKQPTVRPAAQ